MNAKTLFLALLASAAVHAQVPLALTAVALRSLQQASDMSGCVEYAGLIIEKADGTLRVTPTVSGTEDSFELRAAIYRGERVAAIFHTHPLCRNHKSDQLFSPTDIATAKQLDVPSFIWVGNDSTLRVFVPGESQLTYVPKIHAFGSYGTVLMHTACFIIPVKVNMAGFLDYTHSCKAW